MMVLYRCDEKWQNNKKFTHINEPKVGLAVGKLILIDSSKNGLSLPFPSGLIQRDTDLTKPSNA